MDNEIVVSEQKEVMLGSIDASGPGEVIHRASVVAKELAKIIKEQNLSKKIGASHHVMVDGWSTLGAMLGVVPVEDKVEFHQYDDFIEYEATVKLVRTSDGVQVGGASAVCGSDEQNWKNKPRYAVRSMAITRATGKAFRQAFSWIVVLAGYSPTPAEEMDGVIDADFSEKKGKPGKKSDDPTTKFWAFCNQMGIDKEQAQAIVNECGGDFAKALEAAKKNYSE